MEDDTRTLGISTVLRAMYLGASVAATTNATTPRMVCTVSIEKYESMMLTSSCSLQAATAVSTLAVMKSGHKSPRPMKDAVALDTNRTNTTIALKLSSLAESITMAFSMDDVYMDSSVFGDAYAF